LYRSVIILQDTITCAEIRYLFMAGGCIKDALAKQFCVLAHLATTVESESSRIVQAGSNLA
jgi:hypothetical protein